MDSVWSRLLGYPEDKLIVFDNVAMRHTMPVGGGELIKNLVCRRGTVGMGKNC